MYFVKRLLGVAVGIFLLTLCTLKLATADLFRWSTFSEPTKPICGAIIDEWVYNLDALMARAPMATKYKDSDAIYYLGNLQECGSV